MKVSFGKVVQFLFLFLLGLNNSACIEISKEQSLVDLQGSFTSLTYGQKMHSVPKEKIDFAYYMIHCNSKNGLREKRVAMIQGNGNFKLRVNQAENYECSVRNKKTLKAIAKLRLKDLLSGHERPNFAIDRPTDLGNLNLDLDRKEVIVPKDRVYRGYRSGRAFSSSLLRYDKV
ncbi:MAG: hypothetical protein VX583_07155 [Bdellovibrionota bacterium]|nr:hypothetical protein [Pseudobdellovibrionaceae bacterium]|tara:strand:+ start:7027 stop:7548 length:522 start_codon:yes stop_codon:yes gene_type:complete